jgi:hypothetical protein
MAEEVLPLGEVKKVERYLELLKKRAIEKGRVTALEVEPGVQALMTIEPELGTEETLRQIRGFADEMAALSKQFGHLPDPPGALTREEAGAMIDDIAKAKPEARGGAVTAYIERASSVDDPERQAELMAMLDETVDRGGEAPQPPDMDGLAEAVIEAPDHDTRQAAIGLYVASAQTLSPKDQSVAMGRLDTLDENLSKNNTTTATSND